MKLVGVARAAVAVVAGAGLVWGATEATGVADTSRHTDVSRVVADSTSGTVGTSTLTCVGADSAASLQVASMPQAWLPSRSAAGGSVDVSTGKTDPVPLHHGEALTTAAPANVALTVDGKGSLATGLVAGQTQVDLGSTSRGLNFSSCATPTQDGWFFGGGNTGGRVVRLTLVNPSDSATTVKAAVLGASGADPSVSVNATVVAPHERKVVTLGNFAAPLASAAIHLTATGPGVVAGITDAWMTGETPVGENTSTSGVSAAKTLVIPGVSATTAAPEVRVAVPGTEQAIVRVRAVNTSGAVVADTVRTTPGGASDAVPLTGLTAGDYSVTVTADVPVVAAVMSRTGTSGTTDLTWSTPAAGSSGPAGSVVPQGIPGSAASLMLTADARTDVEVVMVTAKGPSTSTVVVPGDRPVVLQLKDATAVWVRPAAGGRVHGALTVDGRQGTGGLLVTVPLQVTPLGQSTTRLVPARG